MSENTKELLKGELQGQKEVFVLYLDDEVDLLEPIGHLVKEMGLVPYLTTEPEKALRWIKERRGEIAMIISDLRMPEIDGFAFREAVLQFAPEVPFSILSAHVDTEIALRGVDLKICAFISKPIDEKKFFELAARDVLARVRVIKEDRELRAGFISESESLLTDGEELLLAIDENPKDAESINRFFGIVHTLKGASGFFEPKTFHRFAHRYEDLLKKLQKFELEYSEDVSAVLFRSFDMLKELFTEFRTGVFLERNLDELLSIVDLNSTPKNAQVSAEKEGSPSTPGAAPKAATRSNEDVKVSVALLDEFMQLSGEVTVIRNMLNKCVRSIERQYSGDRDVAMVAELLEELHKINGGVQNKISEIRKVSVKTVMKAIPRAVRDVSKQIGKQVELEIQGEDLRVDTTIAEVLNNSLLHVVKNSIDHGLETPEKRKSSGKSEKGTVSLRFMTRNEAVVVEVEDDGQGINTEAIKAKLVKNGTHTQEQANALPKNELYAMIFASGFSTAAKVTDISGRGVGMSMVKDSVEAIGGEIQIESNPGQGSRFRFVLPIPKSVLIVSCLSVRAGGFQVGLIQDDILRVLQFDEKQINENIRELAGGTSSVLLFDGELIPLTQLEKIMGSVAKESDSGREVRRIVVMHSAQDGRRLALEVDEVLDVEDTVVKGIHAAVNPIAIYQGVTFLDDGTLGLILSTTGVLNSLNLTRGMGQKRGSKSSSDGQAVATDAVAPSRTALLLSLAVPGNYAVLLEDIQRIEEVRESDIKQSGGLSVIAYRGGVLEIRDFGEIFKKGESLPLHSDRDGVFPIIVVRRENRLIGLKVSQVIDTVDFTELQTDLADPAHGVEGHFFHQEKTITLLALEQVISILDQNLDRASSQGVIDENVSEKAA